MKSRVLIPLLVFAGLATGVLVWLLLRPLTVLVTSSSMEPSVSRGSLVTYVRSKDIDQLKVGALVMVRSPSDHREGWLRRVVGLPGQHVVIDRSVVKIDGQTIDLVSIGLPVGTDFGMTYEIVVPENCVYLVGDNTAAAIDSRTLGPFQRQELIGLVRSVDKKTGNKSDQR